MRIGVGKLGIPGSGASASLVDPLVAESIVYFDAATVAGVGDGNDLTSVPLTRGSAVFTLPTAPSFDVDGINGGPAVRFDEGSSEYIQTTDAGVLGLFNGDDVPQTFAIYLDHIAAIDSAEIYFSADKNTADNRTMFYTNATPNILYRRQDSATTKEPTGTHSGSPEAPNLLVASFSGTTITVYQRSATDNPASVRISAADANVAALAGITHFRIGARAAGAGPGLFLNAWVGMFGLWDRALTAAEVETLYTLVGGP